MIENYRPTAKKNSISDLVTDTVQKRPSLLRLDLGKKEGIFGTVYLSIENVSTIRLGITFFVAN